MEKTAAACAMEWSIELEKGLRSNKPGQRVEAILQMGARLQQWSKEPCSTMVISNIFGLILGEERLFANTILLRLADAFISGDNYTRVCILKAFLLDRRKHNKGKQCRGILSKQRVPNYVELLKRVKIVFDTGDVESRAITLRLLGCWSDIAKDSAEMRHMILSSLGSCNVLEVKASIITASCFSELSEDFAYVFLEVLINMVTSSKTSITIKLTCAKAFASVGYSFRLASRAYKTGKKLAMNSSQEDFVVKMLVSLSKLAFKSMLLISEQVELLLSFIKNSDLHVRAKAIQCMLFLLEGGVCRFPINASLLAQLFHLLNDTNLPTVTQCETLRILLQMFQSAHQSLPCLEMSEIVMWMSIVENITQSPIKSKRLLALRLLVNISLKCRKPIKIVPRGKDSSDLPSQVLVFVLDQVKAVLNPCETSWKLRQECQFLLSLVLYIVEEYPTLGVLALIKIRSCIESLVYVGKEKSGDKAGSSSHAIMVLEVEKSCPTASQIVFCMYKFVEHCIEILNEASAVTSEVHHIVKLIVGIMHTCYFLNNDTCTIQLILLHSRVMRSCMENDNEDVCDTGNLGVSRIDYWIGHERLTCEVIKKMISGRDNWTAYKAGKCAACQGAWFAASFTFRQLVNNVQSNTFQHWLKSLVLFAGSESSIMLLFNPNQAQGLLKVSQIGEIWGTSYKLLGGNIDVAPCNAVVWDCVKNIDEAYSDVCAAVRMLGAIVSTDRTFIFQRWFLNLRAKVLKVVVDVLRLLNSNASNMVNTDNVAHTTGCTSTSTSILSNGNALDVNSLAGSFTLVSFQLNRLAQEFDLLATSFMDMDLNSCKTISRMALNCSLLAFCTGYVSYFPCMRSHGGSIWDVEDFKKCSHSMLLQDLVKRLWHLDSEICRNLMRVLVLDDEPSSCFHLPPKVPAYNPGRREKEALDVCEFAVYGFICLLKEAKGSKDEGGRSQESRARLHLLSDILKKWMNMSFQIPKYFFQIRSCMGAELFVFNADISNHNDLSISPGSHLSLNLCLQLKHVPPSQVSKLYCILASKPSYWTPELSRENKVKKQQPGFPLTDINDTIDLNEKLWVYMTEGAKRNDRKIGRTCSGDGLVYSCVSFVVNERGQGFSACLLDVSDFPVGSYIIKWHSCCIDSKDSHHSLVPLNMGPLFSVKNDAVTGSSYK